MSLTLVGKKQNYHSHQFASLNSSIVRMRAFTAITLVVCLVGLQINAEDLYADERSYVPQVYGGSAGYGGHGGYGGR